MQTTLAIVFIAGWLAVMVGSFFLANRRWRITALPQPKRAFVYAGFALAALVLALIGFAIWLFLAVAFFCEPPGCF